MFIKVNISFETKCRLTNFYISNLFYIAIINAIKAVGLDYIVNFISLTFLSDPPLLLIDLNYGFTCWNIDTHFMGNLFNILTIIEDTINDLVP
jgi:hypothetical protein